MKTISQVILLHIAREFRLMYYRDISVAYQEHSGRTKDERCFGVIFRRCFFLSLFCFWSSGCRSGTL